MLEPMISRSRRGLQASRTISLAAPVGGWNVRDPLSAMPARDAVIMENWFPEAHQIRVRPGATALATIAGNDPGTLMAYNGPTGSKLFLGLSGASPGIFDVTAGTPGAAVAATTGGRFSSVNYSTSGGSFLVAVNGIDPLQLYNGTTWQAITGVSVPAITGVPTNELAFVASVKKRLWFARTGSMSAWYLPVDAIAGALVEFPMGSIFRRGGHLVAMASWSIDAGDGIDDHTIFVTSEGEVAVYSGSDVASAATWTLVGIFFVGAPLGRNCLAQYGGDLLYLCRYGLFPLSKALVNATVDRQSAVTNKIDVAFSQAVASYGNLNDWRVLVFPDGPFVMVNVPTDNTLGLSEQFVMNALTGAWCRLTGWNAYSWGLSQNQLFFYGKVRASTGGYVGLGVNKAWAENSDINQPIVARCQQAYNYLNARGQQKLIELLRPNLTVDANVPVLIGIDTDFQQTDFTSFTSLTSFAGFVWDSAVWDTATWSPGAQTQRNWSTVFAREFYAAALRLQVASASGTVRWTATDLVYRLGSVL